jgi:hypothetical protein
MRSVCQQSPRLGSPVPRDDSMRAQARSRRHRGTVQHEQLDPRGDHHDCHEQERRGARQPRNNEQQAPTQLDYPGDVPEPLAPADVVKESDRSRRSQQLGTAQIEEESPHCELEYVEQGRGDRGRRRSAPALGVRLRAHRSTRCSAAQHTGQFSLHPYSATRTTPSSAASPILIATVPPSGCSVPSSFCAIDQAGVGSIPSR